jgi:hypothetical protein
VNEGLRGGTFGRDRVSFRADTVIVESPADMPDWEFREHRRAKIRFEDVCYFVAEKRLLPGGFYRYLLQPWEGGLGVPGRTITYDATYVTARDAAARTLTRRDRVAKALFFVGPLLGLLPARVKLVLDDRYGFDPQAVTRQCLFVQRFFFYALLALVVVGGWAGALGGWDGWLLALAAAVFVDLIMRLGPAENGEAVQPGFWEWIVPGWKRRARR